MVVVSSVGLEEALGTAEDVASEESVMEEVSEASAVVEVFEAKDSEEVILAVDTAAKIHSAIALFCVITFFFDTTLSALSVSSITLD